MSSVRTLLTTDATISGIVSTRVYVERIPEGAVFPYILLTNISSPKKYHFTGESTKHLYVQVDVFSTTIQLRNTLSEAVNTCLSGFTGTLGSSKVGFIHVTSATDGAFDAAVRQFRDILQLDIGIT
jgi:hypothetical protein